MNKLLPGSPGPFLCAAITVAAVGVFVVPWYVPVTAPVLADSYNFGFSNRTAVIALGVAFWLALIGLLLDGKNPKSLAWFEAAPRLLPPWRRARSEYLILGIISLICATALLVGNAYLVNPYWSEAETFLSRIDLIRLGYQPYRDFQFDYGPALLYPPAWLDTLFGNSLGIENAYAACLALEFIGGFLLYFVFLRFLNLPDRDRPWILALVLLIWSEVTMGMQYTPLRFAALPAALALGHHLSLHGSSGWLSAIRDVAVAMLGSTVCFMISPEMGIACTAGFTAGAAIRFWAGGRLSAVCTLAGLAISIVLIACLSTRYWQCLLSFASGAANIPIYPNLTNLLFVSAVLYVLPRLACSILRDPTHPAAPLAAALGAGAGVLIPAALGRCDPGHVVINGLLIFVLLFPALWSFGRPFLLTWGSIFASVFIVLGQFSYWQFYWPQWQKAALQYNYFKEHPAEVQNWSRQWATAGSMSKNYARFDWRKIVPYPPMNAALATSTLRIADPISASVIEDRYLKIRDAFRPDFYPAVRPELFSPADTARLIADMRTNDDYLLVSDEAISRVNDARNFPPPKNGFRPTISSLMLFPVYSTFVHQPYQPDQEVAEALLRNATVVSQGGGYQLLRIKH